MAELTQAEQKSGASSAARESSGGNAPKILESPEDVLSTMDSEGNRKWIYPTPSKGKYYWMRMAVGWALMALFFALPLVEIGGKPAVFLDVMRREFTFFGLTLYATDTLLLMLFLIGVFVSVVLFTALLGRVWCGWACPQTVYLEFVFRPIERLVEGKESKRRRRDAADWSWDKAWRKGVKWSLFGLVALVMAHSFVAYFVSWDNLVSWMTGPPTEHWGIFVMMAGTTGLILFDFGFFREQMCTITCPYARFQSVLLDRDSLIVSYDPGRGEPRGRRNRDQRKKEKAGQEIGLGDCIDCGACVRTCPTGIDIREGLQMECVSCTQCIDACDDIMESIGKPGGLIRYTSENALEDKYERDDDEESRARILRPRIFLYALLLMIVGGLFAFTLTQKKGVDVEVVRAAGPPFRVLSDGRVANRVKFRLQHRGGESAVYRIEPVAPEGIELRVVGAPTFELTSGQMERRQVWIFAPPTVFDGGDVMGRFSVVAEGSDVEQKVEYRLLGPSGAAKDRAVEEFRAEQEKSERTEEEP
jgi:cytochrome c oxidase accessory protein FixG